jgi:pimeloyl-ACP methyl ester carboxylesterase
VPTFTHFEHKLAYRSYGQGDRTVVLLHGLLFSQRMHEPLARALAERGNRVLTLDLLGHGASDRPRDMTRYSMTYFGEQTIGLLDHLDLDQAVLLGSSLGANTTLEAAVLAPDRCAGWSSRCRCSTPRWWPAGWPFSLHWWP